MGHAGWKDVLDLALGLIAREPAPAQIFIYVTLAFTALMVVEGLRANFFPWKPVVPRRSKRAPAASADTLEPSPRPQAMAPATVAPVLSAKLSRLQLSIARNVKRPTEGMRRHKPMRPQIRRMPSIAAPELLEATQVFTPVNEDVPQEAMLAPVAPAVAAAEV